MHEAMQVFRATDSYVKIIGRTYDYNEAVWLALSGSGIAFAFYGKKAEITIKGDDMASSLSHQARIGIYINGERVVDDQVTRLLKTYTVFQSDTNEHVTVKIVKLSEAAMSTVGVQHIAVDAVKGIKPIPAQARKIEFIGDSITCGYGVDDENEQHHFSTATEDVTQAYAYQTAEALQADYSMVSYSGYGILSGFTENDQKKISSLVPEYYEKVAKSEGKFDQTLEPQAVNWDFKRFVPDLVVINLGTNDESYTKEHADRQEEYAERYFEFLKMVRHNNARATILCTLGIMGDLLYPYIERAVSRYIQETGDRNIAAMKFDNQLASDGYGADWHPSKATHSKAAMKLIAQIKDLMHWK
ncbi:SGNH/GDSL hydrolase family protein [Cohnella hashimotonis]|uniref:GDSL-type esterase/lipase family protein n=1 Tax=Cohnella hashimotonis TaxID=2826895 RepID=A0ABT6TJI8_9BACL|nr:SGNH/GDSL hydrolase family protein [Cohnella hashimotonis]MDI4646895.1 GDSL-type esterase/lipase family protein [Cohnella hashimotonis]